MIWKRTVPHRHLPVSGDSGDGMAERLADDLPRSQRAYASNLTGEGFIVRRCWQADVPAVLDLWAQARSEHANTPDRFETLSSSLPILRLPSWWPSETDRSSAP